jgi:PAS domain S-box-containing protein
MAERTALEKKQVNDGPLNRQEVVGIDKFLSLSNDLFCQTDLQGRIKWVNYAMDGLVGEGGGKMIGQEFLQFVHPEDRQNLLAMMKSSLHNQISPTSEIRLYLHDGTFIYHEVYTYLDSDNKLTILFVITSVKEKNTRTNYCGLIPSSKPPWMQFTPSITTG